MGTAYNAKYNSQEWIGKKIYGLTVLEAIKKETCRGKQWYWVCKCDCGNIKEMNPGYVVSGHSKTCGCGKTTHGAITHGETNTRLYMIWGRMRERCGNNKSDYKRYAGRGIKICDEWHKYEAFAQWARENGYNDTLSIERIDNDGDYCPENCKWIPRRLQARNRGTTLWVDYQGRRMSLAEACEIADMPYKQVFSRIKYMNWPIEDALSIPLNTTRKWKRSERFCKQTG